MGVNMKPHGHVWGRGRGRGRELKGLAKGFLDGTDLRRYRES